MLGFRVGLIVCGASLLMFVGGCAPASKDRSDLKISPEQCQVLFDQGNEYYEQDSFVKAARKYRRFLDGCEPSGELYNEVLQRQFEIADSFLDGRKKRVLGLFMMSAHADGVKLMEQIRNRAGDSEIAAMAAVEVAKSYEVRGKKKRENYFSAYHEWLDAYESYDKDMRLENLSPTGELGKDALLAMARCQELAYRDPRFDVSDLSGRPLSENAYDGAKRCYEQFILRYPEEAQKRDIDAKLRQIDEKLMSKDLQTGQYYQKRGSRSSANLYFQMVMRDWPGSEAAVSAKAMLVENMSGQEEEKK